jgi:curved DNA-binding protein CbpA
MNSAGDHYEILGVSADSSTDALRLAYRELMRSVHPDINGSDEAAVRARAANEAYRVLANPDTRASYDQDRLHRQRRVPTRSLAMERSANRRQARLIFEQEFKSRQSWMPFLALVLISAAGVGILVTNGVFDPAALTVSDLNFAPAGSAEKQRNDLITRIAMADLRPPAAGPIATIDTPAYGQDRGEGGKDDGVSETLTPSSSDLAMGAGAFADISLKSGLSGAKGFSEQCHQRAAKSHSLREADRCTAFDFTASYVDAEVSAETLNPPNAYFEKQGEQAEQVYRSVDLPAGAASVRLAAVKRVVLPMIASPQ